METTKKTIDNLRDQEVDGTNVKGGFTLARQSEGTGYYYVHSVDDKAAAISDAKRRGFKFANITDKASGKTETISL
jgi:hypothetical protein